MQKLVVLFVAAASFSQPPAKGPSPQALAEVKARQEFLQQFEFHFDPAVKDSAKVKQALAQLASALRSADDYVFIEGARDVSNSLYRNLPQDELLKIYLPILRKPGGGLDERAVRKTHLLHDVSVRFGPKAKELLPDVLIVIRDDKLDPYLRGSAIDAAARIAPGDAEVVKAYIDALNSPNPKNTSGVHERIVEHLGKMGKAAWPAKKAIESTFARGPWYQDVAIIALGRLAQDETPRSLRDYVDRLRKIDEIPLEEAAAAFLHIQAICNPKAAVRPLGYAFEAPPIDPKYRALAEQARPVLYDIVANRMEEHVFTRAALRTLAAIGAGSSPKGARILVKAITAKPKTYAWYFPNEAVHALLTFEGTDKDAVGPLADAVVKLLDNPYDSSKRRALFGVLKRFGPDAKAAAPTLVRAFEKLQSHPYPVDDLKGCAAALAAIGKDVPEARSALIRVLADDLAFLKKTKEAEHAFELRMHLLDNAIRMRLPEDAGERATVLSGLRSALHEERTANMFTIGAYLVQQARADLTAKEKQEFAVLLARVLKDHAKFGKVSEVQRSWDFPPPDPRQFDARAMAAHTLGLFGPNARGVLPILEEFARRDLVKETSSFLPTPTLNTAILEARKAVKLVRGRD